MLCRELEIGWPHMSFNSVGSDTSNWLPSPKFSAYSDLRSWLPTGVCRRHLMGHIESRWIFPLGTSKWPPMYWSDKSA